VGKFRRNLEKRKITNAEKFEKERMFQYQNAYVRNYNLWIYVYLSIQKLR